MAVRFFSHTGKIHSDRPEQLRLIEQEIQDKPTSPGLSVRVHQRAVNFPGEPKRGT